MLRRTVSAADVAAGTIEWAGAYHGVPLRVVILRRARARFEWFVEIDGVRLPERPVERRAQREHTALRAALDRVERVYGLRDELLTKRLIARAKHAAAKRTQQREAARALTARTQPTLPGL